MQLKIIHHLILDVDNEQRWAVTTAHFLPEENLVLVNNQSSIEKMNGLNRLSLKHIVAFLALTEYFSSD